MGDSESKTKDAVPAAGEEAKSSESHVTSSSVHGSSQVQSHKSSSVSYESHSSSSRTVSSHHVTSSSSSQVHEQSSRGSGGVLVANSKEQELKRMTRNANAPDSQMMVTGMIGGTRILSGLSDVKSDVQAGEVESDSSHVQMSAMQSFQAESWSGQHKSHHENQHIGGSATHNMAAHASCLLVSGIQNGKLLVGGLSNAMDHCVETCRTSSGKMESVEIGSKEQEERKVEQSQVKEEVLVASSVDTTETAKSHESKSIATNEHHLVSGLMYGVPLVSGVTKCADKGATAETESVVKESPTKIFEAQPWSGTHDEKSSGGGVAIAPEGPPPSVEIIPSTPVSPSVDEMMAELAGHKDSAAPPPEEIEIEIEPEEEPSPPTNTNQHTLVQGLQYGQPLVGGVVPERSQQDVTIVEDVVLKESVTPVCEHPTPPVTHQMDHSDMVKCNTATLVQGMHEGKPVVSGVTAEKTSDGDQAMAGDTSVNEVELLMKSLETTTHALENSNQAKPGLTQTGGQPLGGLTGPGGTQQMELSYERNYHKSHQERTYTSGGDSKEVEHPCAAFLPVIFGMFNGHLVCAGLGIPGTSCQPDHGAGHSFFIHEKPNSITNQLGELTNQLQSMVGSAGGTGETQMEISHSHKSSRTVMEREVKGSRDVADDGQGRDADDIMKQLEEQMSNLKSMETGLQQQQTQQQYHQQKQQQQQKTDFSGSEVGEHGLGGPDAKSRQEEQQINASFGGSGGMRIEMSSHRSHKSSKQVYEMSGSGANQEEVQRKLQEQMQQAQTQQKQPSPSRIPGPVAQSHAESSFEQVVSPDGSQMMTKRSHKTVITSTSRTTSQSTASNEQWGAQLPSKISPSNPAPVDLQPSGGGQPSSGHQQPFIRLKVNSNMFEGVLDGENHIHLAPMEGGPQPKQ